MLAPDYTLDNPSQRSNAIALFEKRDFDKALKALDECLRIDAGDAAILNYKARALEHLGRLEEALHCVDLALGLKSDDVTELCNRTALLTRLSRREEALASLDRALRLQPQRADILIKRGRLLFQLGRRDESLTAIERALGVSPRNLEALDTRGMILDDLGRCAEALADFERVLSIDPNHSGAITNCGVLHGRSGRFEDALTFYDWSLSLNPDQSNAIYNRAVVRLVLGDWTKGFAEFESRWALFPHEATRLARLAPRWTGQRNLADKTILLHHEQGYGDTLQFARYAPLVARRGAKVILAVPKALRRIMTTLPGTPMVVSEGDPTPTHDFHCPLMSLPLVFGTTPSTAPAPIPYLRADPKDVALWSARLGARRRARIGIVWSGRRFPPINHARDMTFEAVRPLLALDADFICLHTELSDSERKQFSSLPNAVSLKEGLEDFADTAGLVENIDLVITVDTAIAHLAGALGKPVWVMNRYATCWRWLLNRSDSPWYPTLRLFRQPTLGDWNGVVREVMPAAAAFILDRPARQNHASTQSSGGSEKPSLPVMLQAALDQHNRAELESAVLSYRRILEFFPGQFDTLHYLGIALAQLRRFEEALEPLRRAVELRPWDAAVHNHFGNALAGLSRYADAIEHYERAMTCDGDSPDSHYNEGIARMALGQYEAALACHTEASKRRPDHAQALNNRGVAYSELGQLPEALADYERALEAQPGFVSAWVNRSDALRRLRRFDEALDASARAIDLDPRRAEAYNGRGATLADLGRYREALTSYDAALELNPSSAEATWNRGLIELSHGNFKEGWQHYEARWRVKSLKLTERFSTFPKWTGTESIANKTLLLHSEQGYGDTIQFSRYCAELSGRGARVILSAPQALKSLFTSLRGVAALVEQGARPSFDLHCPLLSVPLALGSDLTTIPAPRRYLQPDRTSTLKWLARLRTRDGRPRIGLTWSGSKSHNKDLERSIPLTQFSSILDFPAHWISLQKEVRSSDEPALHARPQILRFGEELTDFADTAALIENLDLVISVDTAVAHLAGALGRRVWILLPRIADWRWMQDRSDSPWYAAATLFRQADSGDWESVLREVAHGLSELADVSGWHGAASVASGPHAL
jgi:tetratricopeptide (TPR) repeat protein